MTQTPQEAASRGSADQKAERHKKKALESIQRHLLEHPLDADALMQAGTVLYEMGSYNEAITHLQKALSCAESLIRNQKDPKITEPSSQPDRSPEILKRLGDCYAARQDCPRAVRYYSAAAVLAPTDAGPYLGLGFLTLQGERIDESEQLFQIARDLHPDCSEAYTGLAMVYQQRGDYSAAFQMYLESLQLDTDNLVALLGLFQVSCHMRSFSQIIHYLEVYLEKHPTDSSVLLCLATLYGREGRLGETREAALKVLEHEPGKPEAMRLLEEMEKAIAEGRHSEGSNA